MENQDIIFGEHSAQEFGQNLEELNKALGTGQDGEAYGDGAYNDMSALRPQSLEGTLKVVTAKQEHIKMWKMVGKKQAFNTVEEFNVLDSYGGDSSPFFVEGGLPSEEDSNYIRQSEMVKFMGTTRVLTHPATLVRNTVGDMVAKEQENGTLWLLMKIERALYFGDSSTNPLAFNGIEALIRNFVVGKSYESQHIIDMRGAQIDQSTMEDLVTILADNFASPTLALHTTNQVHKDFSKIYWATSNPLQRVSPGQDVSWGNPVNDFTANAGKVNFVNNVFLKPVGAPKTSAQAGSPATPAMATVSPLTAASDQLSKFVSNDNGTYYYFISAFNNQGESVPVASGGQAVTAGQAVSIVINRVVSAPNAVSYRVYRAKVNDSTQALYAFEVVDAGSGTTQTIIDRNFDIPGTHKAFLLDMDSDQSFCFKQLAPLMKLPLARISASERFMILMYGMIQMYNPRKNIVIKNIGLLGNNSNRQLFGKGQYGEGITSYGTVKPVAR